jgi:hydroxymethylpyrimidine pyrophosphatase-like HAD family hydrolase
MNNKPVYVFDLDGVITHPEDSSIDNVAIGHMHDLLAANHYVAINTGRSYEWVEQHVLTALEDLGAFDHMFIACEKGGESATWSNNTFQLQPSRFALPQKAYDITLQTYSENKNLLSTMFWDTSKKTMATLEKYPEASLAQFVQEQQSLNELLQQRLSEAEAKIDATIIATDIESPNAGKHAGAELIYEWLFQQVKNVDHKKFICLGDSTSDYTMAQYFAEQGNDATFVFVSAKNESLSHVKGVSIIRTEAAYADGTNEYFRLYLGGLLV